MFYQDTFTRERVRWGSISIFKCKNFSEEKVAINNLVM